MHSSNITGGEKLNRIKLVLVLCLAVFASAGIVHAVVPADPSCSPGFYYSLGYCITEHSGNGGGTGVHGVVRM